MRRTTTTAVVLAAAVAAASGSYGLAAQAGDASAAAAAAPAQRAAPVAATVADSPRRNGHGGRGLADLATRLGVSEDTLRQALRDLRPQGGRRADRQARRDAFIKALAARLGLTEQKVRDALPARGRFAGDHHPAG